MGNLPTEDRSRALLIFMKIGSLKPKSPPPPEDWIDPDLVKAFGISKDEEQEAFGILRKRTVLEVYPKPAEPVKTPFEE
jgi:hypothetical protein